jgi:hypothetical protein
MGQTADMVLVGMTHNEQVDRVWRFRLIEESTELIGDARMFGVSVLAPSVGSVDHYRSRTELQEYGIAILTGADVEKTGHDVICAVAHRTSSSGRRLAHACISGHDVFLMSMNLLDR